MEQTQQAVLDGQAVYSPLFLKIYDAFVLSFSNRFVWKCSKKKLLVNFDKYMSKNHLDVGVGSGYFLVKSRQGKNLERVGLLDLNENALIASAARVKKAFGIEAEKYRENVLDTCPLCAEKFDSASVNYLLHCLPGSIYSKTNRLINHIKPALRPGATIFGSTILGLSHKHSETAVKFINNYNTKGTFHNLDDDVISLEKALSEHCSNIKIDIIGSVAVFEGKLN